MERGKSHRVTEGLDWAIICFDMVWMLQRDLHIAGLGGIQGCRKAKPSE